MGVAVLAAAGCTAGSVVTHAQGSTNRTARLGQTIQLTGNSDGEKIAVTPVKVIQTAKGADEFTSPDKGKRFFAVRFRIKDLGSASYNDAPSNGAEAIDSKGQQFDADINDIAEGQSLPASTKLAPGESALGYIVFQVPKHATIVKIQFGEDSGFGQTGEWRL